MPAPYTTTYTARTAYLTTSEYLQAPTGVDVNSLVPGASSQAQTAVLAQTIARASSWADQLCHMVLACTQETEAGEYTADRYARWLLHPRQWPIVDLLAATATPLGTTSPVTLDVSTAWLEERRIVLPTAGTLNTSSVGALQFGAATRLQRAYLQFTYLAGWPNTTLAANAAAGDKTFTVGSALGIYGTQTSQLVTAGTVLTFYDSDKTEQVQVVSVTGSTLTLSVGLTYAHTAGVSVSAFPPAIKQAVISLTSALIKTRGSDALVMESLTSGPSRVQGMGENGAIEDVEIAVELLDPFRSLAR